VGTLYLVATPIGNLEDITLRALRVLREASLIAAEDTRRTRKLLAHYEFSVPLTSYHEHNKNRKEPGILAALEHGDVALVSDAGTPGISDPGYELVGAAVAAGHEAVVIPGASAPIMALVGSGLPTDTFRFLGYLPRKKNEIMRLLQQIKSDRSTLIFFEVPHRLRQSLEALIEGLGGDRSAAACRELTKLHEQFVRGTLDEIRTAFLETEPRGEFTLVIGGAPAAQKWTEDQVRVQLEASLSEGLSPSQAARQVALESGWGRRDVYRMTLEAK
jgi:16S rRNA (cytidine1402-2'-O)-methyltransferase